MPIPTPAPPAPRPGIVSSQPTRPAPKPSRSTRPLVRLLTGLHTQIVRLAKSLVGTPNRLYYRANPRLACASFVSTVLIKVGAIPKGRFTRSASQMAVVARSQGAKPVFRRTVPITRVTVPQLTAGDVIVFSSRTGRIRHTGIALGDGRFVAISSSRLRIMTYDLYGFRRVWPKMQAYRFPDKSARIIAAARK